MQPWICNLRADISCLPLKQITLLTSYLLTRHIYTKQIDFDHLHFEVQKVII